MKRRPFLITAAAGLLAGPKTSFAQQFPRVWRIGFLGVRSRPTAANPDVYYETFVEAMRALGYVEGKNLAIEWRFADGKYERVPALAAELAAMTLDVVVTHTTRGVVAMRNATRTIPIVTIAMGDPVASGVAASLGRPGGNVTGLSLITVEVGPKGVELLAAMVPKLAVVALLLHSANPGRAPALRVVQGAAQQFRASVVAFEAQTPEEVERSFRSMVRERADGLIVWSDAQFIGQRQRICALALEHRMPAMFYYREYVLVGGLMSYGQNIADYYRRAATYVDRILKGTKPSELPFEQPTKIHFAINRATAKKLGLEVPNELLLRADEVIE